jgi:hypothetical protein
MQTRCDSNGVAFGAPAAWSELERGMTPAPTRDRPWHCLRRAFSLFWCQHHR